MISNTQIKAARALLGMKQAELAKEVGLSLSALSNIENGISDPRVSNLMKIKKALEDAGIEFIDPNGGGAGVRLNPK